MCLHLALKDLKLTVWSGIGALFWVPLSTWWGRAPTVFWTAFIAVFLNLGVALSRDFTTYYAFRAVSGLISNAAPTISIAFIRDTFFFHQRARKIGIWTSLFIASPYVGPIVANYMLATTGSWILPLWVGFAAHALYFVFLVLFLDECWYNREVPQSLQPSRPNTLAGRLLRVTGIWQLENHRNYFLTLRHSVTRFMQALLKPVLILAFFN
jgi:MFS family permease